MTKTLQALLFLSLIIGVGCGTNQKTNKTQSPNTNNQQVKKQGEESKKPQDYIEYAIILPQNQMADNNQVEFYPAQLVELDCNQYGLTGNMELIKDQKGENAIKYVFKNSNLIGTLMACPNTIKVMKWVKGASTFLPYRSNLPIKVQVPSNMIVKYRIWTASELKKSTSK